MAANVPQSQPLPGQVANSAGGFSFQVDDIKRLQRFLCLGSEGGSYYTSQQKLGKENANAILRLISTGRGVEVVTQIVEYSVSGRTAKQDLIIFALALCARADDSDTKAAAYAAVEKVCRIPTHLFSFIAFCEALSVGTGWGRAHRRAVCSWYNEKTPKSLAMAVTKYQNRGGWSHRDLFRLCHIVPANSGVACVCRYVIKGLEECKKEFNAEPNLQETITFLQAVESAKTADEATLVKYIREMGLVREHIPTQFLNSATVWSALLENMPMTAMIRNLGKMSAIELLKPLSSHAALVCQRLRDESLLRKARIHPFNVLVALKTYERGRGDKGSLKWDVNQTIVQALDDAFYMSFKFVEPTGKRFLLALDVSGSMCCPMMGSPVLTCRTASAAMAMLTARTEANYHMMGFSHSLVPIPGINASMNLTNVCSEINKLPMGGTDCALPMMYATQKKLEVDVFIVYTDSETWFGKMHPNQALQQYRLASGIDAKLIVCGMASNGFTIADPEDSGMLDMAGFDSAAPEIIRSFALGEI